MKLGKPEIIIDEYVTRKPKEKRKLKTKLILKEISKLTVPKIYITTRNLQRLTLDKFL